MPSTGVPLNVKVLTWKAPLSCELRSYPYVNSKVFHVCSFQPKYQIDSNRWKVKSGEEMVNENAKESTGKKNMIYIQKLKKILKYNGNL